MFAQRSVQLARDVSLHMADCTLVIVFDPSNNTLVPVGGGWGGGGGRGGGGDGAIAERDPVDLNGVKPITDIRDLFGVSV